MTLYIKNMVCQCCRMAVQSVLEKLEVSYLSIEPGKVKLAEELEEAKQVMLNEALKQYGLELMGDKRKILVEHIKITITEMLHSSDDIPLKFSEYLSNSLHYEYTYLANTFSELEGITLERFHITSKIRRVKELLVYEELSLKEIMYRLRYSSVSHLCQQFKKVTGQTPSAFKRLWEAEDYSLKGVNNIE